MTWLTELERLAREAQDTLCEYESGRGSQVWVQEALDCLHAEVPPARLLALIEVVPTEHSDRSTPTRAMASARRSCRSTGPWTSTTMPSALVRMAK